jgi:hypothetical protein
MYPSSPTPNYQSSIVAGRKASLIKVSNIRREKADMQCQIMTFWSPKANEIMGPPEKEPTSNLTTHVLNIFY